MKLVMAFVKPHTLDDVRDAVEEAGIESFSFREIKGFGQHKGDTDMYRGVKYAPSYVPMMEIMIAVRREMADGVIAAIAKAAKTDEPGDGKVVAWDLTDAVDIHTGATGPDAL